MTLSTRATNALAILNAGGSFRYGLETGYMGREQFQWSLRGKNGVKCRGFGGAAYRELVAAGHEFIGTANGFTGISTSYRLTAA